jgi:hypothetical protein
LAFNDPDLLRRQHDIGEPGADFLVAMYWRRDSGDRSSPGTQPQVGELRGLVTPG